MGLLVAKKLLTSHSAFMCSPGVDDILAQCFVLDKNGNHSEEKIIKPRPPLQMAGGGKAGGRCRKPRPLKTASCPLRKPRPS
jgi:hypothetical protein